VITWFLIFLVASLVFAGLLKDALAKTENDRVKSKPVRVIVRGEQKLSAAAATQECDIVRETRGLKAMICPQEIASKLGLEEDPKLYKADSGANSQVGANSVKNSGNSGSGRKVVVLDTGYNYKHPELSSSYLGGKDFVNNDKDPMDDNGHGSHVAGLITADGKKWAARGAAPGVGIIAGKVLDDEGEGYFSDVVAAIYWAVDGPDGKAGNSDDFRADAINLSMGTGPPDLYKTHCDGKMPEMTQAIKYARDRGVVVVVAAGNYGSSGVSIPGCISYSVTVGAVNKEDKIASFSGKGRGVDLSAPGTNLLSSSLGSTYARNSGTSMATPVVSATVALIKHEHPWYSATKVRQVLIDTSIDLGSEGRDYSYGYGRVSAVAAANY
jgi:subtilisin family serine protease